MRDLTEIRSEIDGIDAEITELLEQRLELVTQVAEYKIANGRPVLDKKREAQKLEKLKGLAKSEFSKKCVRELFEQIMAMCRKKQYQLLSGQGITVQEAFEIKEQLDVKNKRIVYQGVEGAYSQMAMKAYFGEETDSACVDTWRQAMDCIQSGTADYAVLPIENSSAGFVSENYDLLMEYDCCIAGEQTIRVDHALLGLPGAGLSDITCVFSHPQALMQCVDFLDEHSGWERIRIKNTALSAKKILEDGKINQAAIASPLTAEIYGLDVLKESVSYSGDNSTRFLITTRNKICLRDAEKVSICFEVPHESGSLYHMLSHFIYNDLNLNKIASRPIKDKSFEYRFFVDFEGNLKDGAVQNALMGLRQEAGNLKILGNY